MVGRPHVSHLLQCKGCLHLHPQLYCAWPCSVNRTFTEPQSTRYQEETQMVGRRVRKRQGFEGTGWTLQTRGNALSTCSPCTTNDRDTGSPRSLSNAGVEKGSEGAEKGAHCQQPKRWPGLGRDQVNEEMCNLSYRSHT